MDKTTYTAYSAALLERVRAMPQALGLVAMGSMAATRREPDAYSDHDFWLVTTDGEAEALRIACDWLPPHREIVLCYKETQHGVKVVYDDGHLIEYAVFERDELAVTRANDYRVLLDRAGITAEIEASVSRTAAEHAHQPDVLHLYRETLTRCLVGALRWGRGERLSGHLFVKHHALAGLLTLIGQLVPTERPLDNIDPFRRVELAYPQMGARLNTALLLDVPQCALALIDVADEVMNIGELDVPVLARDAIRTRINGLIDEKGND